MRVCTCVCGPTITLRGASGSEGTPHTSDRLVNFRKLCESVNPSVRIPSVAEAPSSLLSPLPNTGVAVSLEAAPRPRGRHRGREVYISGPPRVQIKPRGPGRVSALPCRVCGRVWGAPLGSRACACVCAHALQAVPRVQLQGWRKRVGQCSGAGGPGGCRITEPAEHFFPLPLSLL